MTGRVIFQWGSIYNVTPASRERHGTERPEETDYSVTQMLRDLKWQPLADRRRDQRLILLYKTVNGLVAIPTDSMFEFNTRPARTAHSKSIKRAIRTHIRTHLHQQPSSIGINFRTKPCLLKVKDILANKSLQRTHSPLK